MFVFIFSVSQQMDDEGKHKVHSDIHLQVSDAAYTDSDIEQHKMYAADSSDCEMSANFSTHRVADYNILQGITCAHERPEDVQTGDMYSRQVDDLYLYLYLFNGPGREDVIGQVGCLRPVVKKIMINIKLDVAIKVMI